MSHLSNYFRNKLLGRGKRLVKAVSPSDLKAFIKNLKPIKTSHQLIRLGGNLDGGYLVPDDLKDINACFSPGVNYTANFELDLAKNNIPCFLADASVDDSPITSPFFYFDKKFLGSYNDDLFITLDDWVSTKETSFGLKPDYLLQMDIEGAEYEVLINASQECLNKFRIIVIEFHGIDRLVEKNIFPFLRLAFEKLLKNFHVVHIHPNNNDSTVSYGGMTIPSTMEFSFLRKDRVSQFELETNFPHPLDRINNPSKSDIFLPKVWFG